MDTTAQTSNWQKLRNDPEGRARLAKRARIVKAVRDFFWQANFLEVETPQLVPMPSMEPYLEVFETTLLDDQRQPYRAFLTSSPEFAMKKLLAAGYTNLFQICKSYRNMEGWSSRHNPEFTILEWYRANADYTQIMQDCENLFRSIADQLGESQLSFRGHQYDLTQPWERLTVAAAWARYAQLDVDTILDPERLLAAATHKGYQITPDTTWEQAFDQIFLNEIEPHLGADRPTILYEYPAAMAALSRKKPGDPRWAERFEFYIAGLELGNAFGELTDWQEQLSRLQADQAEKQKLGRTLFDIDPEFIAALQSGIPPTSGIAVGIDRLAMVFLNAETIQEVLFFPATELWSH
jgi:lysyl-tRNA synthetase class 2